MMIVLGVDPGSKMTAIVGLIGQDVSLALYEPNETVLRWLKAKKQNPPATLVIEKIASYGMPVGESVFETVYWSGRFAEAYGAELVHRITRIKVKNHICHSARAKDGNVRQALIDRFGPVGTKKKPGPLYGISGDLWSALAVAVTWADQNKPEV